MEEDVLGTMRTLHPVSYVECSRCGTMVRQQDIRVVEGTALANQSEYEQLCPDCYAALVAGEPDLSDGA